MKSKKSILFVVHNLGIGGVEKSLLTILKYLPTDRYDITVAAVRLEGGFLEEIPEGVKTIELTALKENWWRVAAPGSFFREAWLRRDFKSLMTVPPLYAYSKLKGSLVPLYSHYVNKKTAPLGEYDIAVSFQGPAQLLDYYVGRVVNARHKVGWIHFDVEQFYINPKSTAYSYADFDKVFVVSGSAAESFKRVVPSLADRTEVMYNIIDRPNILSSAVKQSEYQPHSDIKTIVTVGRLRYEKGQDIAIDAALILKSKGLRFKWLMVGEGEYRAVLESKITSQGLTDCVVLTGAKKNPYSIMRLADIYVQPSRHEGFGITIGEAKVFGTPIVSTDFQGAHEQLDGLENAIIVKQTTPQAIADAIQSAWDLPVINPDQEWHPEQIDRLTQYFDSLQ